MKKKQKKKQRKEKQIEKESRFYKFLMINETCFNIRIANVIFLFLSFIALANPINCWWWLDYPREWFAPISGVNWYNTKTICSLYRRILNARHNIRNHWPFELVRPNRCLSFYSSGLEDSPKPDRSRHVLAIKGVCKNYWCWWMTNYKVERGRRTCRLNSTENIDVWPKLS